MADKILITGATGKIGSELVKQLSATGISVRAFVRNPDKAKSIQYPNVEIVEGDLGKPETIDAALKGVEKAFLLSTADPCQVGFQGNLIEAATRAGTHHIVKLSALGAGSDSPISLARWHWQTEKQLEGSGIPFTHLRPHSFMQNFLMSTPTIAKEGVFYGSMKDGKISMVDVRDIAAVAANVLTEDGHEGKTYEITGPEALSFAEAAEKLSSVIGKQVTYVDVPLEDSRQSMLDSGMPEWLANALTELTSFFSTGQASFVTNVVADIAKKQPYTFEQFAQDYARVFKGQ